jgi:hypothetical protein
MTSRIFTSLIMAAFPLCGGIWATLVGFEYIGKPPGAELNPKYAIRRRLYRIGGPIVILLGLWVAVQPIVAPMRGITWETFAPDGIGFTIEMPGRPEVSVVEENGEYGPVKTYAASVRNRLLSTTNTIVYIPTPKGFPPLPVGLRKELLKDLTAKLVETSDGELVDDADLNAATGVGKEFRIKLKDGLICRGQFWFLGPYRFQLMVVAPPDLVDSAMTRRFLDSFSYNGPAAIPADSKDEEKDESKNSDNPKDAKSGEAHSQSRAKESDHERRERHENK